jgi:hypothetical protein
MVITSNFNPFTSQMFATRSAATQHINYFETEQQFLQLLQTENLDRQIANNSELTQGLHHRIAEALKVAYEEPEQGRATESARLLLQRLLYHINRLNLFWYDDLQHYKNERSLYVQWLRDCIEAAWQTWESAQIDIAGLQSLDPEAVKQALLDRGNHDLDPPLTHNKRYLREDMSLEGYRLLLAITSLDGLVEASRLSRILGGASNEVQATLIRVLLEEYGNGRLQRKHSTFFAQMMAELDLNTEPEGYFNLVPWEVLACINQNFLLTERKRYFLRYNGGLTYFEIAGPSIYRDYSLAAQRLGLSDNAKGYWELHIREDERHGQWMLQEVALPLVEQYPQDAWEIVLGYDQEKMMGDRAGTAIIRTIQQMHCLA